MKVCSLYGAGFYYMPGTDMCIKIGGWVRAEVAAETNGSFGGANPGADFANTNSRATNYIGARARGYITADAREQTAYGVARGYIDVGNNTTVTDGGTPNGTSNANFSSNRAFVQWAGFTAGLSVSFFDFYPAAAQNYRAGYLPTEDTGDGGWWIWAYTAQFGGGVSATLSAEERRNTIIFDDAGVRAAAAMSQIGQNGDALGGWDSPDIVANLRVDQAWGSAQIMGALHQDNEMYYGSTASAASTAACPNTAGCVTAGRPDQAWGWVVGGGIKINTPFVSPGDYFVAEANYTEGATRYLFNSGGTTFNNVQGGTEGYGLTTDCVYGGTAPAVGAAAALTTNCHLTTGWSAVASYEHYWTPQWHQDVTGGYMQIMYDSASNAMLCQAEGQGGAAPGSGAVAAAGCNNNWGYWGAGSRLQWDITKSFYIGVEALYSQVVSAQSATGFVPTPIALGGPTVCANASVCSVHDEGNWAFTLRMHKDFLP